MFCAGGYCSAIATSLLRVHGFICRRGGAPAPTDRVAAEEPDRDACGRGCARAVRWMADEFPRTIAHAVIDPIPRSVAQSRRALLPIAAASVLVPRPGQAGNNTTNVLVVNRVARTPQSRVAFNLTAARHAAATALSDSDADPHHPCPVPPGGRAFAERAGDPVPVLQRWDR